MLRCWAAQICMPSIMVLSNLLKFAAGKTILMLSKEKISGDILFSIYSTAVSCSIHICRTSVTWKVLLVYYIMHWNFL